MKKLVTCTLCSNVYQAGARDPLVLPCGHNFCRTCLNSVNVVGYFLCPTCKVHHSDLKTEQLYLNQSILQLSDSYKKSSVPNERCSEHGDYNRYWCITCEEPLCSLCIYYGHPQGHNVKLASTYIQERKTVLENEVRALDDKCKEKRTEIKDDFNDFLEEVFVILSELCRSSSSMHDFRMDVSHLLKQIQNASAVENILTCEGKLRDFVSALEKVERTDVDDNPNVVSKKDAVIVEERKNEKQDVERESEKRDTIDMEERKSENETVSLKERNNGKKNVVNVDKYQETCSDEVITVDLEKAMTDTQEQLLKDSVAVTVQDETVLSTTDSASQAVILKGDSGSNASHERNITKCDLESNGKSEQTLFKIPVHPPPKEDQMLTFRTQQSVPPVFNFGATAATVYTPASSFSFGTVRENKPKEDSFSSIFGSGCGSKAKENSVPGVPILGIGREKKAKEDSVLSIFGTGRENKTDTAPSISFGTVCKNNANKYSPGFGHKSKEDRSPSLSGSECATMEDSEDGSDLPTSMKTRKEQELRRARLSWRDGRVLLHSLSSPSDTSLSIQMPSEVFMELKVKDVSLGRVYIRLWSRMRRAQQFLALCLGNLGPSYLGTKAAEVVNKGEDKECLVFKYHLTSYLMSSSEPLLTDLEFNQHYTKPLQEGFVIRYNRNSSENKSFMVSDQKNVNNSGFAICTRDDPGLTLACAFGEVVSGLDVVKKAVSHNPVTDVTIAQCGLVMPDCTRPKNSQSPCASPAPRPSPTHQLRSRVKGRYRRSRRR